MSVLIAPARVQGDGAADEIARAIRLLNMRREVDVIIVGRGGGSIEDLWSFNEEPVARAIFDSKVPVISAVGHETDFTIADFVADIRASTPSAAAEIVTKARDEMHARIAALTEKAARTIHYRLLGARSRLTEMERSRGFHAVVPALRAASQRIDESVHKMESAFGRTIREGRSRHNLLASRLRDADVRAVLGTRRALLALLTARLSSIVLAVIGGNREQLSIAAGKLGSLSPLAVLGRGYAIAFDAEGRVIKRSDDVAPGERIKVKVAEGEMDCTRN
jgi:exodeoxyribonuclease VII large subunit